MSGVNAYIAGWGRDGWGAGPWSQSTVGSATGSTNAVTVVAEANAPVTGLAATGAVNGVTVVAEANLNVTGVEGTLSVPNRGGPTFTAEGDAQLSTAQKKFGTASLLLDGAGDYVKSGPSDVTSGNFTVEFFVYTDDILQDAHLWDNQVSNSGFALAITSLGKIRIIKDNVIQGTYNSGLSSDTWHHIALVGNGNVLTVFVDGFPKGQKNIIGGIGTYSNQPYYIGARHNETQFFNRYIDEFRASNTPRYSGIFTPTTTPFEVDDNTLSLLHFDGADGSTTITNELNIGAVSVTADANVDVTGVSSTGSVGSVTINAGADVQVEGPRRAISRVGSVTVTANADVDVTGVSATGAVGDITIEVRARAIVTAPSAAATSVGTVTVEANSDVSVTGVAATGAVGSVLVWGDIVPNQDPNYSPEVPAQTPNWNNVVPNQNAGYTSVEPTQSPGWSDESPSQNPGWTRKVA